ncbi:MAG: dienelactone hydrolase family protein [Opitutaceae bacterium]
MKSIFALILLGALPLLAEEPAVATAGSITVESSENQSAHNTQIEFPDQSVFLKRKGKFIDYNAKFKGGGNFTGVGYLVLPEGASPENPVPGVVVVHEWWGQTEYIRKRAEMLADLGYAAFAIDMYGDGRTAHTIADAGQLMFEVTQEYYFIEDRFMIGMKVLQDQPSVDASNIAAIGYSVGGKMAMQVAALNPENLHGVVVFHGAPDIDIPKGTTKIEPRILICNGADDTLILQESLDQFKQDIEGVHTDITWELYPGAINGFTNPDSTRIHEVIGSTVAYHEAADQKSWASMQKFLSELFTDVIEK